MSAELFAAGEMAADSPKLAWKKRYGIITWFDDGVRDEVERCEPCWFAGFAVWWPGKVGFDFFALETAKNGWSRLGEGDDEDEALRTLCARPGGARVEGIKFWFEEGA